MSLLVVIIALVAAGGICLWVSGLLLGGRAAPVKDSACAAPLANQNELLEDLLRANRRLAEVEAQLAEESAARCAATEEIGRAETELERAAGELGRAEAELDQASYEIARLKAGLEAANTELADMPTLPPDPPGAPSIPPVPGKAGAKMTMAIGYVRESSPPESAATDSALAELDLERVAHAKTQQFLEEARARIESLEREQQAPSKVPSLPRRPDRKGPGFSTVSIATRDQAVPGVEHDRLRQSHDQLRVDKERLEAEHEAALARLAKLEGSGSRAE